MTPTKVRVPYLDLRVQDKAFKAELLAAVDTVLTHGRIVLGPEVAEFEKAVAAYCGRKLCVGVNSGTDALYFALRSLGVGPGDEVITTPMSWIATFNAIRLCGATPVAADVREDMNMDPARAAAAITPKTKAIVVVHYNGLLCDMEALEAISKKSGVPLVEDAAQAFGAVRNGRKAGAFGRVAAFSMNSMKVFNSYGEAGAVLTDDPKLADKLVSLRYNGTINKEECIFPSLNGRLDTMQAAMMLRVLPRLGAKLARRREIAALYGKLLKGVVELPVEKVTDDHVFYTYVIRGDRRDALITHLLENGVENKIHHKTLMTSQPAYADLPKRDLPVAEKTVKRILSIPNHEGLTDEDVRYVAGLVRGFYGA